MPTPEEKRRGAGDRALVPVTREDKRARGRTSQEKKKASPSAANEKEKKKTSTSADTVEEGKGGKAKVAYKEAKER